MTEPVNPRAVMGDNRPPTPLDSAAAEGASALERAKAEIALATTDIAQRLIAIAGALGRVPDLVDADNAGAIVDQLCQADLALDRLEAIRVKHKRPFDALALAVHRHCLALGEPVRTPFADVHDRLEAWQVETDTRIVHGSAATSYLRTTWDVEIVKPEDVPRAYWSPDLDLLKDAVAAGMREIPGVKIKADTTAVLKSR